jgi:signal transduction histidine kinase
VTPTAIERLGRWFAWLRAGAVPLAFAYVATHGEGAPAGHVAGAYAACVLLAAIAMVVLLGRRSRGREAVDVLDRIGVAGDFAVVSALVILLDYLSGQPLRALVFLPVIEAALRFGFRAGVAIGAATVPVLFVAEVWHLGPADDHTRLSSVVIRGSLAVLTGAVVGRLSDELTAEVEERAQRAAEAERLRDELGRRVDILEAASRCARALASSLELGRAFHAFIRELRGLVPYDRVAVVLEEGASARVIAADGAGGESVYPPGSLVPLHDSLLAEVLEGRVVHRADMRDLRHADEELLLQAGLRSRVAAPLQLGTQAIGMLSLSRREPDAFTPDELELVSLLGRLVAGAVQNIRAYDSERTTAEELRRLSALRADFVSLVSHELRSPMAAVIGSARTLQARWRELAPEQRESFLALIADETGRLAALIGDVLDTSRIEAGTFSYSFGAIDVAELVRETVAAADLAQDEVNVQAAVREPLPAIWGDRDRIRQVLTNLIDNAVKYSGAGSEVEVTTYAVDAEVRVEVADRGAGIPSEDQRLIFEKFGRARAAGAGKPGTGLGLFIARSIAEAHGGSLEVRSALERGSTFTLSLPTR